MAWRPVLALLLAGPAAAQPSGTTGATAATGTAGTGTATVTGVTGTTGTGTMGTGTGMTGTIGTGMTGTGTGFTGFPTSNFSTGFTTPPAWNTTAAWATTATQGFNNTVTVQKVKIGKGKKTSVCTFFLVFEGDQVDIDSSSVTCKGKAKGVQKVSITTPEGFIFGGKVRPPRTILSLEGGDLFAEEYKAVNTSSVRRTASHCGGYDGEIEGRLHRGYTTTDVKLWPAGQVSYAFVSNGDAYRKYAFYTDSKVGYSQAEMLQIMKSLKRIEEKTCIRFKRVDPDKNKPWLLMMREASSTGTCYKSYIDSTLKNKIIGKAGKPFDSYWEGTCFQGAYVDGLGMKTGDFGPIRMVTSAAALEDSESTLGLIVHEILHALGVGHTQKRPDRDTYITVNWNNVLSNFKSQYEKCTGNTCQTHNTAYDCSSIMHYSWDDFASNGKTMTAKDANKCSLSRYNTKLTDSDITLLKKMYCDGNKQNLVTSPNYPSVYSASTDKEWPLTVAEGSVVEISFTDFLLEAKTDCSTADWVEVLDGDGTVLLKKSCGSTNPGKVTSKTKLCKIKFHSDGTYNYKGFRAEWKAVKKVSKVDGGWSGWGGWGSCSNNKDGKTACSRQKFRYCNNPAAANGGAACPGSNTEKAICTASELTTTTSHPTCVITGGWSAWGAGSACNSQCKSTKKRTCNNPTPINSKSCDGLASLTTSCTGGDCSSTSSGSGEIKSPNYPNNYPNSKDESYPIKVFVTTITICI